MEANNLYFLASDLSISQEKSNDIFLVIDMRMLSNRPNKNREGVTEAFIDEIVANQEYYSCLPLYGDIQRLKARDYRGLTHMQNRITGSFGTTQVGGMLNFRKVNDEYGISQIGEARIPKREHVICERVIELYERGELNFSFEIRYTEDHVINKDGILYIDAAEHNVITGMAIVSVPAYAESFALSQVAEERTEVDNSNEEVNKGVEDMAKADNTVTEQVVAEDVAVEETVKTEEVVAISEETKPEVAAEQAVQEAVAQAEESEAVVETVAEESVEQSASAEEVVVAEEDVDPENTDEDPEDKDDKEDDEPKKEERTVAELEMALAKTEADWAIEHAQYMALEAEVADLKAAKAALDAEIERLRACEAEQAAFNAAKEAEELSKKQGQARVFAEKQGLNIADEEVSSAIASLDYTKIAELSMAQDPVVETTTVSVASFAVTKPMKISNRFENVLKRVSQ